MATNTKQQPAAPAANGLAAIAAQTATAVQAAPAAPVKPQAVVYVNGMAQGAPANAPALTGALAGWAGPLPASNPANRQAVGTTHKAGTVAMGNGKGPKAGHNVAMFAACTKALASGPQTMASLAAAVGSGGAAFVAYACKNGWLALQK